MTAAPRSAAALAAALLLLGGCSPPPVAAPYGGQLVVVGPSPGFAAEVANHRLPPDWLTLGRLGSGSLSTVDFDGHAALRIANGDAPFIVVRRVDGRLDVNPFLSWAWQVTPPAFGPHPVSLIVGFRDPSMPDDGGSWFDVSPKLPPHNHLLTLMWGESALARGSLRPAGPNGQPPARYIVRGGIENGGRWFTETVDLSGLYRRLWPGRAQTQVRIAFIGFAAAGGRPPVAMNVSALTLSR